MFIETVHPAQLVTTPTFGLVVKSLNTQFINKITFKLKYTILLTNRVRCFGGYHQHRTTYHY